MKLNDLTYLPLNEEVMDWNGKKVVWSDGEFYIAVNSINDATYITAWNDANKNIGFMSTRGIAGYSDWLSVRDVDLQKKYQSQGLGIRMYQALLQYMNSRYNGIVGYKPDIINDKVLAIYQRLGGETPANDADVILVPRQNFFESIGGEPPARFGPQSVSADNSCGSQMNPVDRDGIKKSKQAPKKQVKANAKALSAKGHPPQLDPYHITEMVRRPFSGTLNDNYEIVDDADKTIGVASVTDSVINALECLVEGDEQYRGQVVTALLDMIVNDADRSSANLTIQLDDEFNTEIKSLMERFGFRLIEDAVMFRNAGSIRPVDVNPAQGMVNRDN